MAIVLDYIKDAELFNKTAQDCVVRLSSSKPETKSTQMRNFYEYVLDLYEKSKNEKNFDEILPFVKMLNSKVAYAKSRGHINDEFVSMIKECVTQVTTAEQLRVFKLFFEAVIGFSKK
ncbi:MAG: hypothetical protein KU29_04415 [Sulfurovum sp. FS06-10]|nr:MAG: hypothetical protein KU29_04415 [Sulfurovum sp. FS06-10]